MVKLPEILNRVEATFIDGTPKGYTLRILRFYRERCNEKWVVSGLSSKKALIYDLMNEHQVERATELDKAINILEQALKEGGE